MPAPLRDLLLFLGCFGLFGFFAHGYLENSDAMITMQGARAWLLRGNPGLYTAEAAASLDAGVATWPTEHVVAAMIRGAPGVQPTFGRSGEGGREYVWFPIGHQAALVPFVAVGERLDAAYPELAQASERLRGPIFGAQFGAQFVASFLSPLAAAISVLLLVWIARCVGAGSGLSEREAVLVAACATLGTQFLPGAVETTSNASGTALLLGCALGVAQYAAGGAGRWTLAAAGFAGGVGVLVRYPQALAVACLGLWLAASCWRQRRRWTQLGWFALGGLPSVLAMLALNAWRFGDMTETGYSASAGFGGFPAHVGLFAILAAPGKGVLWFTPLLWLIVPSALTRRARSLATAAAAGIFIVTIALYSGVVYWAAGQCWGIRFMTAPIALLATVVFAQTTPWRSWPRRFFAVVGLGTLLSLGGLITAYPGHQHLAFPAGRMLYGDVPGLDNNVNFDPRLSPLHTHWTYAWASLRGRLDPPATELEMVDAVFGVQPSPGAEPSTAVAPVGPPPVTDRGMHHLWPRWLALVSPGFPWRTTMFVWLGVTTLLLAFGIGGRAGRME